MTLGWVDPVPARPNPRPPSLSCRLPRFRGYRSDLSPTLSGPRRTRPVEIFVLWLKETVLEDGIKDVILEPGLKDDVPMDGNGKIAIEMDNFLCQMS